MVAPIAVSRHLVGAPATFSVTRADENGEASPASGAVTVGIRNAAGVLITSDSEATTGDNPYSYVFGASQLDLLSATWNDGGAGFFRTTLHEIVGGYYFSVAEAREFDSSITESLASDAKIIAVRREVEDECERITGCAWVPRYRRKRYDTGWGQGRLLLDDWAPRTIRSVSQYSDATTYVAFTDAELAAVSFTEYGQLTRRDGGAFFGLIGGLVVEYEYGYDTPPPDLKHAALTRLRYRLKMESTGIPDRATSFLLADGGAFSLATAGRGGFETGIPDVDAVYQRYSVRTPGVG